MYNSLYFIKLFSAIPEEKWKTGTLCDATLSTRCALGHCNIDKTDLEVAVGLDQAGYRHPIAVELAKLFTKFFRKGLSKLGGLEYDSGDVYLINDSGIVDVYDIYKITSRTFDYSQFPTPKQRILAVLYDIYKEECREAGLSTLTIEELIEELSPVKEEKELVTL